VARKYSVENILDGLTAGDRREIYGNDEEREPEILTVNEADRLLTAAVDHPELDLLAPIVLGLFCGIRTEELKKLQWQHVNLEEGFVTIGRDIAKKRRIRNVTLPENAKQWLSICSDREGEITRSNFFCDFDRRFNKLLRHAGFVEKDEDGNIVRVAWKKNGMRHSFGSYHFALHADSIKTSNELGHRQGDNVLFEHYRALTTKKSGQQYFNLKPSASAKKVVAFAS
jgi:integrase